MELRFTVSAHVSRPVHDVFEAVADAGALSAYFATGGAKGRLAAGRIPAVTSEPAGDPTCPEITL